MVSLHMHGMVKSFGHLTYGLQYSSTVYINAHRFNTQLDRRSVTKQTMFVLRFEPGSWMTERECSTNYQPLLVYFLDEAHNLDFYYEQAQDYPVDLYYLMDLSKSMEDDKEKLSALGDLLAATMQVTILKAPKYKNM
jgi:hypothetical protein